MKKIITLCLLFCLLILRGYAQNPEPEIEEEEEESTEMEEETPQKGLDNVWRSSDLEGENPVMRAQKKLKRLDGSAQLPEGSARVGCICMDYFVQKQLGRGACTGHNGVRFWLYAIPSGDTVQIATLRHESNPDTLSNSQILQLAAYKRYERLMAQKQIAFFNTLEEHPEWLGDFLGNTPSVPMGHDTIFMPLPFSPVDNSAKNTLLYSLSVAIGSGALWVIKKLTEKKDSINEENDLI